MTTTPALTQTRAAVHDIAQHAPVALTRTSALLLDQQLRTTCTGTPPPGALRQVVIAIRHLAGPGWLDAHAEDPGISAFTRLDPTPEPPPLPVLDHILARCLQTRFGPASTTQPPQPDPGTIITGGPRSGNNGSPP
jgi:hypothetical protein